MTTAVALALPPIQQFFDNAGRLCAGGSVLTQVGGVNYPTYQDSAGSTPLPNPIPLNSRGEISNAAGASCQLFLVSGQVYTFTLFDAAGNQLNQSTYEYGVDFGVLGNLSSTSSASAGAGLVGFNVTLAYLAGSVGLALQSRVATVKDYPYSAKGDGSTDDTTVIKAAIAANQRLHFPPGNYIISDELVISAYHFISGAGRADQLVGVPLTTSNITGTRIVQTAAKRVFCTQHPATGNNANYVGELTIMDLAVQGQNNASQLGLYGIDILSSLKTVLVRVNAYWFVNSGIRLAATVANRVCECGAEYNTDAGLLLDYDTDASPSSYNAYDTLVDGGRYNNNGNAGIKCGTSTVGVKFLNVDIESNGSVSSPGGNGYGIQTTDTARSVDIDHCWFEANKNHVVASTTSSLSTVPQNLHIHDSQLWNSTGANVILLNGRGTIIENNEFYGGGVIQVKSNSGNPILRNNLGNPKVQDSSVVEIPIDTTDMTNNFPYSDFKNGSYWTLTNCTVAVVYVTSPAGFVPVYKVTPTAPGTVRLASINASYTWMEQRQTIGAYFKSDATAPVNAYIGLGSVGLSKAYMDSVVDSFLITKTWAWQSIGRAIDVADITVSASNQSFNIDYTAATTDPFYISGFVNLSGICNLPYRYTPPVPAVVAYSASMTFDAMAADEFLITATNGSAFTINAPTSPAVGMRKSVRIINTSGGGLGAITWDAIFKLNATALSPATANNRTIMFEHNGANWVEISRTTADVPN